MSRCRRILDGLGIALLSWGIGLPSAAAQGRSALGPSPSAVEAEDEVTLLAVQAEVQPVGSAVTHSLGSGERLHSGDRIALKVQVDHPVYVTVLVREPSGEVAVVYPQHGPLRVFPGAARIIPEEGKALELDEQVGEESLFVIASKLPLPQEAKDIYQRVIAAKATDKPQSLANSESSSPPDKPPPMPIRTTDRGIRLICAQKVGTQCVKSNAAGIAVAKLAFSHSAKRRGPLPTTAR